MVDVRPSVTRTGEGVGVSAQIDAGLRAHMSKVYGLMAAAMAVTALVAYVVGTNAAALQFFFTGAMRWVVMFAPLIFVFAFSAMINSMSASVAQVVFYAFGAVMGVSIAWIFAVFNLGSIFQTFLATAVAFAGLSLYGYTTKTDLSGMGRFLVMALIGLIVVMIINFFLQSEPLHYLISAVGILIFAGLTAYDTQRIKNEYLFAAQASQAPGPEGAAAQEWLDKSAIMGALGLYLNFINMFMFLLQFMGGGDE